MPEFTVAEILDAAEKNKYKNFNEAFIAYDNEILDSNYIKHAAPGAKAVKACVIGEAFLNLGLVENGTDAATLSRALVAVKPDEPVTLRGDSWEETFYNLSSFINDLNGSSYKGKKRIVKLARKYFSKSLQQKVSF